MSELYHVLVCPECGVLFSNQYRNQWEKGCPNCGYKVGPGTHPWMTAEVRE